MNKPDPSKAIHLKRGVRRLPKGVRLPACKIKKGHVPELRRKPFFLDGATYVPTSRYYKRKKHMRDITRPKIVGGDT